MQLPSSILVLIATVCSIVSAVPTASKSKANEPFGLQIKTDCAKWNNKYVSHTHIGAAYNLAIPSTAPEAYYLNTTDGNTIEYKAVPWIPYHFNVGVDLASNIGALYVSVDYPTYNFEFDSKGFLKIGGLERWFICTIATAYGPKSGIAWEYGTSQPSIKDCVKIRLQKTKVKH